MRRYVVMVLCALAVAGLSVAPGSNLHRTVLTAMGESGPDVPLDNLSVLLSESMPEIEFEPVAATLVGLDPDRLAGATKAVRTVVEGGAFPGAALVAGRGGRVVEMIGLGVMAPGGSHVSAESTIYDLASLTKVVATTTAVMLLVEDGRLDLNDPVSKYLPAFTGGDKDRVTIRQLLTHTSGLPAGVSPPRGSPATVLRKLIATPLRWEPGERMVYSDLGPIVVWAAVQEILGEPPEKLLQRRVFGPLGMDHTGFRPESPCTECAPTTTEIRGHVHDPLAQRLGGVAGNAGLFSTASDLGRFAAMLANGGELGGVRVLQAETIRKFTRRQSGAENRGIGWEKPSGENRGGGGRLLSPQAFGHTGFTGTSLWVDPARGTWAVLLTNDTYKPHGRAHIQELRRTVNNRVACAADVAAR